MFENIWLQVEGYLDRVGEWIFYVGTLCLVLAKKFKLQEEDLRRYNGKEFGILEIQKAKVLSDIRRFHDLEQYRPLNEEEKSIQDAAKGKVKMTEG